MRERKKRKKKKRKWRIELRVFRRGEGMKN